MTESSPKVDHALGTTAVSARSGKTNGRFFMQMAASSALALARGFILAHLLVPTAFGGYALLVSLGTFSASLLSFGQIERSFKRFPRLFVDGHPGQALAEADGIIVVLARRAAVVAILMLVLLPLAGRVDWLWGAACAIGVAFTVGMQSAYISVHRASGELTALGQSALARGALAVLFAAGGAILASWPGAITGEILAAALGGLISRAYVRRSVRRSEGASPLRDVEPAGRELWLFTAFIAVSAPLYLDRVLVSLLFGKAATGTYALLMLFVMGSATLTSIVSQKLGPQLVGLQRSGQPFELQLRLLFLWVLAISAASIAGAAVAALALLEAPLSGLGSKYHLTAALMLAMGAMCAAQVSHLFEWLLISHDRERRVFEAAAIYLLALGLGLVVAVSQGSDLAAFMWVMAAGKLLHVTVLALSAVRLGGSPRRRT
jgi:hypothetical protein